MVREIREPSLVTPSLSRFLSSSQAKSASFFGTPPRTPVGRSSSLSKSLTGNPKRTALGERSENLPFITPKAIQARRRAQAKTPPRELRTETARFRRSLTPKAREALKGKQVGFMDKPVKASPGEDPLLLIPRSSSRRRTMILQDLVGTTILNNHEDTSFEVEPGKIDTPGALLDDPEFIESHQDQKKIMTSLDNTSFESVEDKKEASAALFDETRFLAFQEDVEDTLYLENLNDWSSDGDDPRFDESVEVMEDNGLVIEEHADTFVLDNHEDTSITSAGGGMEGRGALYVDDGFMESPVLEDTIILENLDDSSSDSAEPILERSVFDEPVPQPVHLENAIPPENLHDSLSHSAEPLLDKSVVECEPVLMESRDDLEDTIILDQLDDSSFEYAEPILEGSVAVPAEPMVTPGDLEDAIPPENLHDSLSHSAEPLLDKSVAECDPVLMESRDDLEDTIILENLDDSSSDSAEPIHERSVFAEPVPQPVHLENAIPPENLHDLLSHSAEPLLDKLVAECEPALMESRDDLEDTIMLDELEDSSFECIWNERNGSVGGCDEPGFIEPREHLKSPIILQNRNPRSLNTSDLSSQPSVFRYANSNSPYGVLRLQQVLEHRNSLPLVPSELSHEFTSRKTSSPSLRSLHDELVAADDTEIDDTDSSFHSVVEVSSLDPRAAARAAAILKMNHAYIEHGILSESSPRSFTANSTPRHDRSHHFDSIETARLLSKDELLHEAELEIFAASRSRSRSRSMSRFTARTDDSEVVIPGVWKRTPKRKFALPDDTPIIDDEDTITASVSSNRPWGIADWKRLERVYSIEREKWVLEREVRPLPRRMPGGLFLFSPWSRKPVAQPTSPPWDLSRVVDHFLASEDELHVTGEWDRDVITLRVKALELGRLKGISVGEKTDSNDKR